MSVTALKGEKPSGTLPPEWEVGPGSLATGRYVDEAFLKLEFEKLWSTVWQVACRVDAIPNENDYTVYKIGDREVIVLRAANDEIKAYHNVCPHRGTALADGQGTYANGKIICPFHGWRWDTQGENEYVLERQEFKKGKLEQCDVALKTVHCRVFEGMVFINFAENPESFDAFIAPIRELMEGLVIGEMRHYWWKTIDVPANWKVAQEAFFEGYHVPATHPQLEPDGADQIYGADPVDPEHEFNHHNVCYQSFERGHGRFYAGKSSPMKGNMRQFSKVDPVDAMADRLQLLADGMDAQVLHADVDLVRGLKGQEIPEDSNLGAEYVKALYTDAAARNRPMAAPIPEHLEMWGGELFMFPNICMLFSGGNMMMYRSLPHPTDPNRCTFEIFSTTTVGKDEQTARAEVIEVTDMDDPEQVYLIPRQDLGNIPRIQRGLKTRGVKRVWLASYNEQIILNMHRQLDEYLTHE